MSLLRRTVVLAVLLSLPAPLARAQAVADPSGHWEGALQAPLGEVVIEIDLARNPKGDLIGTFTNPKGQLRGYPLANISVENRTIKFELKANSGGGPFEGTLFSDGKSMSGDFRTQGYTVPFNLARTGDARIEPAPKSQPVAKELEGVWNGTLAANGGQLQFSLRISNHPDGTATGTVVTDLGVEIPVTMTHNALNLALEMKVTGGSFSGVANAAGTELAGTWTQGPSSAPLTFTRGK